jgi:large subunit ribosomal protein L17
MHRHAYKGRKLGRDKAPRELMFRNLATSIVLHEKVRTTLPKAKEIRPLLEKLITTAKKGDVNAIRKLSSYLLDKNATEKLITEIAPLYEKRNGGYTRITKVGLRVGDAAQMATIELLDVEKIVTKDKTKTDKKKPVKKEEKTKAKKVEAKASKGAKVSTKASGRKVAK